ncbi:MAG: Rho termination factor N-terminal domain-containing protein, partial [Actinomycetota bacterium]|nr:Rho termination factor N-terminal domain-containing protein [Actinomycetota bacterium]
MSNTDVLSSDTNADPQATAEKGQGTGANGAAPKRRAGLSGMVLAELRDLAGQLGITSTAGMRKGDLIAAIKERQGGGSTPAPAQLPLNGTDTAEEKPKREPRQPKANRSEQPAEVRSAPVDAEQAETPAEAPRETDESSRRDNRRRRGSSRAAGSPPAGSQETA